MASELKGLRRRLLFNIPTATQVSLSNGAIRSALVEYIDCVNEDEKTFLVR